LYYRMRNYEDWLPNTVSLHGIASVSRCPTRLRSGASNDGISSRSKTKKKN
jgi:hypothetical protein